ncbi:MAG TPA: SAM-dependent methyltransferase [Burkholderiaceae bacterium]|nr:SAM-dependent methyltransferase [Burkholderiaceae bacterium]HQR71728.1 SAM-dependent methyltransferase [Burkholderiaceae bacterium]
MTGTLYLLPCPIAEGTRDVALPHDVVAIARTLSRFLAENAKSARAFLKDIGHPRPIRELTIVEIGHAPRDEAIRGWLAPLIDGSDAALVSEAGCPAVADPGATIVAAAHRLGVRVRPLVGPSSLLLALMASGLNGQGFRFHGYLPVPAVERRQRLQALERESRNGETQIFIETPYRSRAMYDAILAACAPGTRLSVAADLTGAEEYVMTRTTAEWRGTAAPPPIERRPTVFSLLA